MAFVQALITILSLINPAICVAMFTSIEAGRSRPERVRDATLSAATILGILFLSALAGVRLLDAFGISLPAFKVAGGMVLIWMGFSMLRSSASGKRTGAPGSGSESSAPSLTSLVLFAASPGTITGVITLAVHHSGRDIPLTTLAGILAAVLVTWGVLLGFGLKARAAGPRSGGKATAGLMGLIVLAMGVQFALSGIQEFFRV